MTPYEKEVVYTMRNAEGMITSVFDPKTSVYLKVVDTAITIDSSESDDVDNKSNKFARFAENARKDVI